MSTPKATVRDGRFVIDTPAELPEGTEVEVALVIDDELDDASRAALEASLARSAEQIARGELHDARTVLAELASDRE